MAAEAQELVRSSAEPTECPPASRPARAADGHDKDRTSFWNRYFATEDPWNYSSSYEQEKYERQLEILPAGPIGRALELACAEGHFTRQLAPRVGRLIATDISAIAIGRAEARCSDQPNVEFGVLDFCADTLPGEMDLIVCSEVFYYLDDLAELRRIAKKFAEALRLAAASSAHTHSCCVTILRGRASTGTHSVRKRSRRRWQRPTASSSSNRSRRNSIA
ncbi:hypothetical protein AJ88_44965 [Mesorhizobium amorphae CCBAU 01583]|nr:hypothetical protein AJ88_44965 [Mesorhizobium amorphae CCBAU 01583]